MKKNYFDGDDGMQNILVFQIKNKYFERRVGGLAHAYDIWESKGLSNKRLSIAKNNVKISKLIKPAYVIFSKDDKYFQQDKLNAIAAGSIVNIYIVYKLSLKTISSSNTLKNYLFGATEVKKANNTTDLDKWQYRGYGLAFDWRSIFTHPDDNGLARNVIIFGADLSNSTKHATNKTQIVFVLGRDFIQKVNDTTIYVEKVYSPNFSKENKIFVLSLY